MIKHLWTTLCKKSLTDVDTNLMSLIDILEEVNVDLTNPPGANLPVPLENIVIPFEYEIVSFWEKDEGEGEVRADILMELFDPNKNKLGEYKGEIVIPGDKGKIRTKIKNSALPINEMGKYTWVIQLKQNQSEKYKIISTIPLQININRQV